MIHDGFLVADHEEEIGRRKSIETTETENIELKHENAELKGQITKKTKAVYFLIIITSILTISFCVAAVMLGIEITTVGGRLP
jgi:hypothetical protein